MRNTVKLIMVLLLVVTKSNAQENVNLNQGYIEDKTYYSDINYKEINEKIIIDVSVEGVAYKFMLDTGAPTAISKKLYDILKLEDIGAMEMADQSGLEGVTRIVSIPEIQIGNILFKDTPAFVADSDTDILFECLKIDGIIGSNQLRNSVIQFNRQDKKITITDSFKKLGLKRKTSFKMIINKIQSSPFIPIKLINKNNTGNEYVLFDSGDNDFYVLANKAYEKFYPKLNLFETLAQSTGTFSIGYFGTAKDNQHLFLKVPEFKIGAMHFQNVLTKTTYNQNSRIGAELLHHAKLTLDYKRRRFWLESFHNKELIDLNKTNWPIDPVLNNQHEMVVGIVWDPELREQINPGDKILQFGEVDYTTLTHCDIITSNLKVATQKAIIILEDKNTGEIKKIELQKR